MCASKSDRCDFLSLLLVMEICCQLALLNKHKEQEQAKSLCSKCCATVHKTDGVLSGCLTCPARLFRMLRLDPEQ